MKMMNARESLQHDSVFALYNLCFKSEMLFLYLSTLQMACHMGKIEMIAVIVFIFIQINISPS